VAVDEVVAAMGVPAGRQDPDVEFLAELLASIHVYHRIVLVHYGIESLAVGGDDGAR
jgi:hypothetical protein